MSGWRSSSISVHDAVPELVWCPANIIEMNMPVISSAENRGLPASSLAVTSTSSMSRFLLSAGGLATREPMMPSALQLVVKVGEPGVELLPELLPDQARRGGVNGQLGEEVEEVDLAAVAPVGDHLADFVLDGGGVALHLLATQGGVVQHLLSSLRACVEVDALAEDRRHEGIRLGLVEIAVRRAEEELAGLRARQQDDLLAGQLEEADVAALVAHPLHQR